VKRFDQLQLAEAPFNSNAYASDRQTFIMMARSPLSVVLEKPVLIFEGPFSNLCCRPNELSL